MLEKLYLINEVVERFRWISVVDNEMDCGPKLALLRGKPVSADFGPIDVEWTPETLARPIPDFPNFRSNLKCISSHAMENLKPLLRKHGQFIPLRGLDYIAFYCL